MASLRAFAVSERNDKSGAGVPVGSGVAGSGVAGCVGVVGVVFRPLAIAGRTFCHTHHAPTPKIPRVKTVVSVLSVDARIEFTFLYAGISTM
jgi:hypothetical protein